ncbi:MAG TPA: site-2 protease family protein, partial [Acidimicrobiia bacterium]|nr:site-2 protease family protein [Acidimicrobiia bacterium]
GLLTLSLAGDQFPAEFPGEPTAAYWIVGLVAAGLFFASVLAHELAHSLIARRHGVQVDGITLWMLGGVARLGGESPSAGAELRIAGAGPATSVGLAALFGVTAYTLSALGAPGLVASALAWLALINGILALFNLIPAAPLDGGRILSSLLWFRHGNRYRAAATSAQVGVVFGWLLVGLGGAGWLFGFGFGTLWTALIGWFLVSAARAEGQLARSRVEFGDVRVRDVMTPDPPRVRGWLTVDDFLREDAPRLHDPVAVVERFDGTVAGLVSVDRLRSAPAQAGVMRRVQDFAVPVATLRSAQPDDLIAEVAARPARSRVGHTLVFDGDRLVGIVTPEALTPGQAVSRATP